MLKPVRDAFKDGIKTPGRSLGKGAANKFGPHNMGSAENIFSELGAKGYVPDGTKALGKHGHPRILPQIVNKTGAGSKARKAASAMIAKIPLPLSRYIAATFKP